MSRRNRNRIVLAACVCACVTAAWNSPMGALAFLVIAAWVSTWPA